MRELDDRYRVAFLDWAAQDVVEILPMQSAVDDVLVLHWDPRPSDA